MEKVLFYEGPWYAFSNFSSFAVFYNGRDCMTSEHAYHAEKFLDEKIIQEIMAARSAHDAKVIARKYQEFICPDWYVINLRVMEEIVRAKLEQHPYIRKKLLETGDAEIIEDSPRDSFWGRGPDWKGKNHLGKIWMKLRAELKNSQA